MTARPPRGHAGARAMPRSPAGPNWSASRGTTPGTNWKVTSGGSAPTAWSSPRWRCRPACGTARWRLAAATTSWRPPSSARPSPGSPAPGSLMTGRPWPSCRSTHSGAKPPGSAYSCLSDSPLLLSDPPPGRFRARTASAVGGSALVGGTPDEPSNSQPVTGRVVLTGVGTGAEPEPEPEPEPVGAGLGLGLGGAGLGWVAVGVGVGPVLVGFSVGTGLVWVGTGLVWVGTGPVWVGTGLVGGGVG